MVVCTLQRLAEQWLAQMREEATPRGMEVQVSVRAGRPTCFKGAALLCGVLVRVSARCTGLVEEWVDVDVLVIAEAPHRVQ